MKNFLLASNIVLLVLVGVLFYLHFNTGKKEVTRQAVQPGNTNTTAGNKVAYIDLDSLQENYDYYKKIKVEFERKQNASNDEVASLQKKYQGRAVQLQQKGPSMTPQEQQGAMDEINKMQQDLQNKKQVLDNELYNYNTKMKEDILKRIQDFLKDYNSDARYSYIFSYEPGLMFYKDSTLNITADVIKGLNDLYTKAKK